MGKYRLLAAYCTQRLSGSTHLVLGSAASARATVATGGSGTIRFGSFSILSVFSGTLSLDFSFSAGDEL